MAGPWSGLLDATITYQVRNGVSNSGDPTFAAQATTKCRVEKVTRRSTNIGTISEGIRWETATEIMTEVEIPVGSRIWLPGANTGVVNESVPVRSVSDANIPNTALRLFLLVV